MNDLNPLFKKGANDFAYKNLRPVSNLQFLSKITERVVFDQVYAHVMKTNCFPSCSRLTGNHIALRRRWLR